MNNVLAAAWTAVATDDDLGGAVTELDNQVNNADVLTASGPVFKIIQTVFVVIGIAILILSLFKVVKAFAAGKIGDAAKVGVGGVIAAILCLNLALPIQLVNGLGGLAGKVVDSVTGIAGEASGDSAGDGSTATPTQ